MKVVKLVYAEIAAMQLTKLFNEEFGTTIGIETEIRDGTAFILLDFAELPQDLVFRFAYELGYVQKWAMQTQSQFLPDWYRLPKIDENY